MTRGVKENVQGWMVVGPIILYYVIFGLIPLGTVIGYSFLSQDNIFKPLEFTGINNFITAFTDERYYKPFLNTLIIAVFTIGLSIIAGLFLAMLMCSKIKGKGVYRTIYYIPTVVSMAIIAQIVNVWLSPTSGTINNLFGTSIVWKESIFWMFFWLITICVWKGLGATIILYVAGISGISHDIYEAAEVDGASKARQFFSITLPLLKHMHIFVLITSIIGAFNIFEPVQLISNGEPKGATKVILFLIYDESFKNGNLGMGSALSVIVLVALILLTALNMAFGEEKKPKKQAV